MNHPDAVVILHGLFGSSSNWRSVATALSKQYRVLALDLRNHGRSPRQREMDYRSLAGDVVTFIAENADFPVHLVGHSLGGKVAMTIALDFPDCPIQSLSVIDIAPIPYPSHTDELRRLLRAMSAIPLANCNARSEIDQALGGSITDTMLRQYLLKNIAFDAEKKMYWQINLAAIDDNLEALTDFTGDSQSPTPCLFVKGALSDYIPPSAYPLIAQYFPNSDIHTLADSGHLPHITETEKLCAILQDHFVRHSRN